MNKPRHSGLSLELNRLQNKMLLKMLPCVILNAGQIAASSLVMLATREKPLGVNRFITITGLNA